MNEEMVQLVRASSDRYIDWALQHGPLIKPLTDEEREESRLRRIEELRPHLERWAAVMAASDGALRKVVSLHEPSQEMHDNSCVACSETVSGYEYDCHPWPCATFLTIEREVSK